MNFTKRLLMIIGVVALATTFGALLAPKTAHAVVATLVQVVGNVSVVSPSGIPLVNRDIDNGPRQAFVLVAQSSFGAATSFGGGTYTFQLALLDGTTFKIPSGHRLVVEYISGYMDLSSNPGSGVADAYLVSSITSKSSSNGEYRLELAPPQFTAQTPAANFATFNHFVFAQPVRAYVDANGLAIFIRTVGNQTGAGAFAATATGYLVNCTGACPPQQ